MGEVRVAGDDESTLAGGERLGRVQAEHRAGRPRIALVAVAGGGVDHDRHPGVARERRPRRPVLRPAERRHRNDGARPDRADRGARDRRGEQPGVGVDVGDHRREAGATDGGRGRDEGERRDQDRGARREREGAQRELEPRGAARDRHDAAAARGGERRGDPSLELGRERAEIRVPAALVDAAEVREQLVGRRQRRQHQRDALSDRGAGEGAILPGGGDLGGSRPHRFFVSSARFAGFHGPAAHRSSSGRKRAKDQKPAKHPIVVPSA